MANEAVLKVFHAARQDIEIVWHRAGLIPHPIFDTQVAAMVLGYGDSISYDQLVQRITGDALDKSNRFTDWSRRPLTEAQLAYAVSDVTHLRDVYLKLSADLERRGRTDWVMRRDGRAHLALDLSARAREGVGAAQDARAQAARARGADRGRGLARARGAGARRAARPRAQGRGDRRHRGACPDHAGKARAPALDPQGVRTLEMGRRHPGRGGARARARSEVAAAHRAHRSRRRTAPPPWSCSRCCCA